MSDLPTLYMLKVSIKLMDPVGYAMGYSAPDAAAETIPYVPAAALASVTADRDALRERAEKAERERDAAIAALTAPATTADQQVLRDGAGRAANTGEDALAHAALEGVRAMQVLAATLAANADLTANLAAAEARVAALEAALGPVTNLLRGLCRQHKTDPVQERDRLSVSATAKPLVRCQASMGDGECIHEKCPASVKGDRLFGTCPLPWADRDEAPPKRARKSR